MNNGLLSLEPSLTEDGAVSHRNRHILGTSPNRKPSQSSQSNLRMQGRTPSTSGEPMEEAQSSALPQQTPVAVRVRRSPEYYKDYNRD